MDYKDISKWLWDIAKYVITAVIISSFLGGYKDDTAMLYLMGFIVAAVLMVTGQILYIVSKRKK